MTDFVSWVYEWIGIILLTLLLPWVLCFSLAMYHAYKKKPMRVIAKYIISCGIAILIVSIFAATLNTLARVAVVNEVERIASGNGFQVYIEGSNYENPYDIATSFSEDHLRAKMSGSNPKKEIDVYLSSSEGEMKFIFYRDSRDKDVYWVWYRGYNGPHNGHFYLKTNLLDDY